MAVTRPVPGDGVTDGVSPGRRAICLTGCLGFGHPDAALIVTPPTL